MGLNREDTSTLMAPQKKHESETRPYLSSWRGLFVSIASQQDEKKTCKRFGGGWHAVTLAQRVSLKSLQGEKKPFRYSTGQCLEGQ